MKRIRSGIEPHVRRNRLGNGTSRQFFAIGGVVNQTASGELRDDVTKRGHAEMLGERTTQLVDPLVETLELNGHCHRTAATG